MRPLALFALSVSAALAGGPGWPQWGGPDRNFHVHPAGSVGPWGAEGPREIWKRSIGFGHSSVVVDPAGRTLFTMYRTGDQEAVIALDAKTGRTLWERLDAAKFLAGMNMDVGPGPHATPLLANGRIYTAGVTGVLQCLDARTGEVKWRRDLIEKDGGTVMVRGYSSSPLAWRGSVIVQAGGPGKALLRLNGKTGAILWSRQDFKNSHASPILVRFRGRDQVVVLMDKVIAGIDPANGALLWSHAHDTIGDHTAGSPLWSPDGLVFVSSAYNGGSRVVELTVDGGRIVPKELWAHKRMRVHHSNVIRLGDYYYGTSGDFGPAVFQAVHARTGEVVLRDRSFARANSLHLGDRTLVLDENGLLALCRFSPDRLDILARYQALENKAWTPPSLVGTTLYLRDRKTIKALSLR